MRPLPFVLLFACGGPATHEPVAPAPRPSASASIAASSIGATSSPRAAPRTIELCGVEYPPSTTFVSCPGEPAKPRHVDLAPVRGLVSLEGLDIHYTDVHDLAPLAELKALKQLNVHASALRDISALENLPLEKLEIAGNHDVHDYTPLSKIVTLRHLSVGWMPLSDASILTPLVSLTYLDVDHTGLRTLAPLSALSKIEFLDVSDNDVADLTPLRGLVALRRFSAASTKVRDLSPIAALPLEDVFVIDTPLTSVAPLMRTASLKKLAVSDLVPRAQIEALKKAHPGLVVEVVPRNR